MILRTALTSDEHIGSLTSGQSLVKMYREIASFKPDLMLRLGDDNGGLLGFKAVRTMSNLAKNHLGPEIQRAEAPGNHDLWLSAKALPDNWRIRRRVGTNPSPDIWLEKLESIYQTYRENGSHSFNTDGPLRLKDWTFVGHTLWYTEARPETNDCYYLPLDMEGDTNRYIYKRFYNEFWNNIDKLTPDDKNVVIVSHFPQVGPHYNARGEPVDEISPLAESLMDQYPIKAFFNGHMHQKHLGPLRYEAGSNKIVGDPATPRYDRPRFLILDMDSETGNIQVVHHCV